MALTYYLKIDGIAGDSTDVGHEGWFELTSFAFGDSNDTSVVGGATGVGKVTFQDLMVALANNAALVALLTRGADGKHIAAIEIEGVTVGPGGGQTVYDLTLNNVLVSSVSAGDSSGGIATTQVSFNYGRIGLVTTSQNPDGSLGAEQRFGWDLVTNAAIDPAILVVPSNTTTAAVPDPVTYFVKIDGIAGDSTSVGHEGWFELSSFSFGESNSGSASAGGGGAVGQVNLQDLSLVLANNGALSALLARSASGKHIAALEIEGVTGGPAGRTVYDLTLNNILVSSVSTGDFIGGVASTQASFNFERIGLVTTSQNPDGSLGPSQSFGWDVVAKTAINPADLVVPSNTIIAAVPDPVTYFIKIDGIAGDSTSEGHEGWFELSSFSLGESFSGSVTGGGGGVGKANFQDLAVALANNSALAALFLRGANGKHLGALEIEGVTGGATPLTVYNLTLNDVLVTSVQGGDSVGGIATPQVTFNYGQIGLVTTSQNPDGSLGAQQSFGWNLITNTPLDPATLAVPVNTATAAVPDPVTYYLKIDGVAGTSTDAGHEGWFELSAFSLGQSNSGTVSGGAGGAGAGKVNFQDLSVLLADNSALTALLIGGANGKHLRAVEIEGVIEAGNGAQTVYDLTLNDVLVSSVSGGDSSGGIATTAVSFNYAQIGLVTSGQNPDGSFGAQQSFGWDLTTNTAINPATLFVPVNTATVAVPDPVTYFVRIDGIAGDSTSKGHEGWFELSALSFGQSNSGSASGGGGATVGRVNFQDLSLTLAHNTALAALLTRNADGKHITAVEIEGVTGGASGGQTVYDLTLNNVLVSSVSEGASGGGGPPITNVSLNYARIGIVTTSQNPDGSLGARQSFGWDLITNTPIDPASLAVATSTVTAAAADPVTYYLKIDGILGGSTSKGHEGWFELSAFSLGQSNSGSVSGGSAGVGKVNFQDLSVTLTDPLALAALLARSADGKHLLALEIEGVTGGAAGGRTVYDLTLNDVLVSSVATGAAGSTATTNASFNFGLIGLVTTSQNPDGSLGAQQSFGWDLATNARIDPASLAIPDNMAPLVAITSQLLDHDTGPSGPTLSDLVTSDGRVTLTGTASDDAMLASVHIFDGATDLGAATLDGTLWTFSTMLTAGTHALRAVATDARGKAATTAPQPQVVVDDTAPTVAIASQLLTNDTGASATDRVTSDGRVTLTGTAADGVSLFSVRIFDGTTDLGAATLAGTNWSFGTTLALGTHALRAVATDIAGNVTTTAAQPQISVIAFDPIVGQPGQMTVNGTAGADTIIFGTTNLLVSAGTGDDLIAFAAGTGFGVHRVNGGAGTDTLDLSALTTASQVNLATTLAIGSQVGITSLSSIENVIGGSANDIITASDVVNRFTGGNGADTFTFASLGAARNGANFNPSARDTITDFHATAEVGATLHDLINLRGIDAIQGGRDDAFVFNASPWDGVGNPFTAAGQLRYQYVIDANGQEHTIIIGNVNAAGQGNGLAPDFQIDLIGHHNLTASDFIF